MNKLALALLATLAGLALFAAPANAQEAEGGRLRFQLETDPRDRNEDFRFVTAESLGATSLDNFTLEDDREEDSRKVFNGLSDGRYRITAPSVDGWDFDSWDCEGESESDINISGRTLTIDLVSAERIDCEAAYTEDEERTPTPSPMSSPTPTDTPAPTVTSVPTPVSVACIVGNSVVTVVGSLCPAVPTPVPPTAVPTAVAPQVVVQSTPRITPPASGSAGLLPTSSPVFNAWGDDSDGGYGNCGRR